MTNAGFVSTAIVPAAGVATARSEQPARQGSVEGEFADLLSRFAAGREEAPPSGAGDPDEPPVEGERPKTRGWLGGSKMPWSGDGKSVAESAPTEPASSVPAPTSGEMPLEWVAAARAVLPVTEKPANTHPQTQPAPDGSPRPNLPPLVEAAVQELPSEPQSVTTATVTVLKRETHLAPGSASAESAAEWTAAMLGRGDPEPVPPTVARTPDRRPAADVALPDSTAKPATVSPSAVSPLRAAQDGPGMSFQREPPMPEQAVPAEIPRPESTEAALQGARPEASAGGGQAPAPVRLIATRILETAATTPPPGTEGASAAQAAAQSPLMTPAKVFHIQLQPAELGTVTVRMSLKDNTLRLEVEAGRGETARMLQNEGDTLSSLLRSAGYLVDGLEVRIGDTAATSNGGQSGTSTQWGGQSGLSQGDARSSRPQDDGRGQPFGDQRGGGNERVAETDRGSGVYV